MKELYIVLGAAMLLIISFFTACYVGYRKTFYRSNKKKHLDPKRGLHLKGYAQFADKSEAVIDKLAALNYEDVYITSHDGLRLHGRYMHNKDGAPLAIQCHGYKSASSRDFSGGALLALELGFNVLLIDQRAHEESDGNTITFGDKERYDCLGWINYSVCRFGEDLKIILYGLSMGAATVILTAALDIPKNVLGVFADCPYSSAPAIIKNTIKGMGLSARIMYPIVRLGGIIFGKTDPERARPDEAAKHHKVPIVIVHGEGDTFVPHYMSEEIYENLKSDSRCSLNSFKEAEHGISFMHETQRYCDIVRALAVSVGAIDENTEKINAERLFQ